MIVRTATLWVMEVHAEILVRVSFRSRGILTDERQLHLLCQLHLCCNRSPRMESRQSAMAQFSSTTMEQVMEAQSKHRHSCKLKAHMFYSSPLAVSLPKRIPSATQHRAPLQAHMQERQHLSSTAVTTVWCRPVECRSIRTASIWSSTQDLALVERFTML